MKYPDDFINQIIEGDCLEVMKNIPDNSVDLIIADPPYYEIYGEFDFLWDSLDHYIEWSKEWITECYRILKLTGSFYMWGAIGYNKGFPLFKLADWIETNKMFHLVNWITQRNSRGRGNKRGYMCSREEVLFFVKSSTYTWNTAYTKEKSSRKDLGFDGKPRKNLFKRCSDVWIDIAEASQSSKERFGFPTVKALALCDRIITSSSNPLDVICIPFAGSGSEIVSAINNNRKFIGIEKEPKYVQIAKERMNGITGSM